MSTLASAAGAASFPRSAERNSPLRFSEKLPPLANTLTQFARPGQPVLKRLPPVRDEPACGSSGPPLSRC